MPDPAPAPNVDQAPLDVARVEVSVLVGFDAQAARRAGGMDLLLDSVFADVARANHAFATSRTGVTLRVVSVRRCDAPEARDPGALLNALVDDPACGELRRERDRVRADLVTYIAPATLAARGKAFVMSEPDPRFAAFAYSVVSVLSLGGLTLAHEIAHNFGCDHDREHVEGAPPGGPAFGWRFCTGGVDYRTIMSRQAGVALPVFSSPRIRFGDSPAGTARADNASVIRANAGLVASFR